MICFEKRKRVPEHFYTPVGSSDRELYILDGDHLIVAGTEDSQSIINSYRESTDLNLILERMTEQEYQTLVNSRCVYMDTTQFPQTLADIKNDYNKSVAQFNSLPEEVQKELGGTLNKFSKMSDSEFEDFLISHSKPVDPVVPDVGGDE